MKLGSTRAWALGTLTALPLATFAVIVAGASGCSGAKASDANTVNPDGGIVQQDDPPHAVGLIALGEQHSAGSSSVTPIVSAAFAPDSTKLTGAKCTKMIAGCEVPAATPKCTACADNEVCSLDSACNSTCVKVCTLSCASDEECYFATPTSASCRKVETFNAGALAFAGTTTPITLFPPYSFSASDLHGAPFLAGASVEVQGSGATVAGFDKFDETFKATTFLQTNPSLDKIGRNIVFGAGSVPIGWVPGNDTVVVEVVGPAGGATCKVDDTAGHFDLPRAVIQAVSGDAGGTPSVSLSVSRQRLETHKTLRTKGTMTTATVQPVAYLSFTTSSSETTSYQGCFSGETLCGDTCIDTMNSSSSCGQCGHACVNGGFCESGVCSNEQGVPDAGPKPDSGPVGGTDCTTCVQNAGTGVCSSASSACSSNADCNAFNTCVNACTSGDTTCENNCQTAHPTGSSLYSTYVSCVCNSACPTQCATECGN